MRRIESQPKAGTAEYQRWYRRKNPQVGAAAQRKWRLKTLYNITPEEYDRMMAEQGGVCGICSGTQEGKALAVDHCHTTGAIRGLLCENCYVGIGKLNDDPVLLEKAMRWIK